MSRLVACAIDHFLRRADGEGPAINLLGQLVGVSFGRISGVLVYVGAHRSQDLSACGVAAEA